MTHQSSRPEFPEQVHHSTAQSHLVYRRLPDAFAVHGGVPPELRDTIFAVVGDGAISFGRGELGSELLPADRTTPVYSLRPGGTPAVPTGRVLVRFAEGDRPQDHAAELERSGYRIAEPLAHTPEAAWVESADRSIAHALARLPALESLPGIVNVEPQMIRPSRHR